VPALIIIIILVLFFINESLLKELTKQLLQEQNFYCWLQLYSVQIWNKIGFVRNRKGLKISETTITQNLIFDFWQLAAASKLPVEIYESRNEKANGNDLEIFVETSKGFISFPCQAKIIQKNNHYNSIHHRNKNNSVYQIDMLIEYADRNRGIPIYLLYNYCNNFKHCQKVEELTGYEIENYGCSIVNANFIKENFPVKRAMSESKKQNPFS
jgi:hypothetical protein